MAISLKLLAYQISHKEKKQAEERLDLERALIRKFARGNVSLQNGNFVTKAEKLKRIEKLASRKRS